KRAAPVERHAATGDHVGLLSDVLTESLAKHSRVLTQNCHFNGHPDLLVKGVYPNDAAKAGTEGVEIKTTRKPGGAVDTHGAREQWMAVFVYAIDGSNGTRSRPRADVFHRGLPRQGNGGGFSQKSARRTWHSNGY